MLLKWHHSFKLALYTFSQHRIWLGCNWVQLAHETRSHRQSLGLSPRSTTPLRVDLDSNASLWYAVRDVDSLTIRRILTLTLYLALIYRLRRGRGRCNWVQLTKCSECRETLKYVNITKRCNWVHLAKLLRILLKTWKYTFNCVSKLKMHEITHFK